jgi:signal transduction histidine kinase
MAEYRKITVWVVFFCWMVSCGNNTVVDADDAVTAPFPAEKKEAPDDDLQKARSKNIAARAYINKRDFDTAQILIGQSLQVALEAKDLKLIESGYNMLIAIDSMDNNFQSALMHLKKKEKVLPDLYAFQKKRVLLQHDTLQRQIANEQENIRRIRSRLQTQTSIIVILAAGIGSLLIVGFVQIIFLHRKKRLMKRLQTDNEQNLLQADFLTGQMEQCAGENQQLIQQNDVLEKNNLVKDKLLSVISHDLRSPTSSLQALLNLFNANNIARKDLVDFFGKLLSRVENTSTMLENLLQWSQYQLNGIEPIFEKTNIQMVIDDSINFYRMQAEQKHIIMDNSLKTSVQVRADVEMLKVVLRNIISNALKFTRSGGIINIKALTKDDFVIVSVKDTGIGINAENQSKIFAGGNFTTPGVEKEKGTGLGLQLCKDFVELHHGKIWLDSKVDVGTTFYFSIPLAEQEQVQHYA